MHFFVTPLSVFTKLNIQLGFEGWGGGYSCPTLLFDRQLVNKCVAGKHGERVLCVNHSHGCLRFLWGGLLHLGVFPVLDGCCSYLSLFEVRSDDNDLLHSSSFSFFIRTS